ncbi:MAG: carboxypeptidase-like regulatory domain-containing protein [Chloroflexi bacterium]|nr:carboxypeptidase-like regulatory domain-containing protein [Chloroflexota bacterium]
MSLDNSPSLKDFANGLPASPPPDSVTRKRRLRLVIAVLAVVALLFGAINFFSSSTGSILRGVGSLQGRVTDGRGNPLAQAEIYWIPAGASTLTAADGSFTLNSVPAGENSLVAAYKGTGSEVVVDLPPGQTLDVGSITINLVETPVAQ